MSIISLSIIELKKVLFNEEVVSFIAPGVDGDFGVLVGHAPLISILKEGNILVEKKNGSKERILIKSGFLNLVNNQAIIIVD